MGLPALIQQALGLGFHLGQASGGGFLVAVLAERVGRFEARPARAQEQLVRGVRSVLDVEHDLHHIAQGRDVPEPGVDARRGGRPGQDGLEVFLLGAGGFRRVLVPRMPGRDPAHPGAPPLGRPLLHRPLRPLDHPSDDARIGATGGVQDRLGLHPGEHATAGTLPPPDQDGGLLPGRPRPARPHRIRNSTGNPRKTRFRFMSTYLQAALFCSMQLVII